MQPNWNLIETIAKAIVVIGGMIVSLYQLYTRLPKSRGPLTRDLEILKILDRDDPAYTIVRAHVDKQIAKIYEPPSMPLKKPKIRNWDNLIIGVVFLVIFAPWTYTLYNKGSWWALLTGFLAVGGVGNVGIAFERRIENRKRSTEKQNG